jgi:hypothetical protein
LPHFYMFFNTRPHTFVFCVGGGGGGGGVGVGWGGEGSPLLCM